MGLLDRFLSRRSASRLRVLALGSCRVIDPLRAVRKLGLADCLNRRIRSRTPVYLHDINEMIQFLRLVSGALSMPDGVAPMAFRDWRAKPMPALLDDAERLVIEVCTDKHYQAMGWTLNVNEIHRQLVEPAGNAGQLWWSDVHRGDRPPREVVEGAEAALGRAGKLTEVHRLMLREIAYVSLSAAVIAEGMATLRGLVRCPVLVVPHVAVRLADGGQLAERIEHIDKTIEAARLAGLAVLDPRSFVERDGQQRALDKEGTDFHHYADDYLPVVGREIVRSLRQPGVGQVS